MPFDLKVDLYIKSLEAIFDREKGARKERARVLLDSYREGDDRKIAKNWDKERKSGKTNTPSININHSTISGSGIGSIERGTFTSEKRDQKETNLKHRQDDEGEITDKKTKLKSPRTEGDNFLDELKDDKDISYKHRRRDSTLEDKVAIMFLMCDSLKKVFSLLRCFCRSKLSAWMRSHLQRQLRYMLRLLHLVLLTRNI